MNTTNRPSHGGRPDPTPAPDANESLRKDINNDLDEDWIAETLSDVRRALRMIRPGTKQLDIDIAYNGADGVRRKLFESQRMLRWSPPATVGVDTAAPGTNERTAAYLQDLLGGRGMVFELDPNRDIGEQIKEIIRRVSDESIAKQVGFATPPKAPPTPAPAQNHSTSEPTPAQRVEFPTDQLHSVLRYLAMPSNAHPAAQEVLTLALQAIHTRLQALATELRSRNLQWTRTPPADSTPSTSSPPAPSSGA